jgi:hypothetical protein
MQVGAAAFVAEAILKSGALTAIAAIAAALEAAAFVPEAILKSGALRKIAAIAAALEAAAGAAGCTLLATTAQ